ncbi:ESS family glutamate:Na+ symporter [Desulfitispora alkaliphila]|uniref:sodium/glutamate symporter n=1 Tax=Desulfitispora alkaliphila TaxID=622674 RepID=UPI003D1C7B6F
MGHDFIVAFGWISLALVVGTVLRSKISFLQSMLVPSCVIGGLVGFVLINTGIIHVPAELLSIIAFQLFVISFISIGLTDVERQHTNQSNILGKNLIKGAIWMAVVWQVILIAQSIVGVGTIMVAKLFGSSMDPYYGFLLPFGFAQGPGQAVAFGTMFEGFGYENAAYVGLTISAIGFLLAFLVGVPLARLGIVRGLAKNAGNISEDLLKGYFPKERQKESMGYLTFHNANIETLAFHFALIMITYLIAYSSLNWIAELIPSMLGTIILGILFVWGLLTGYLVKWIMRKFKVAQVHSNDIQKKITGWFTDYLIVCTFMTVQLSILKEWISLIIITCLVGGLATALIAFYFGQRTGLSSDFERSVGLYGMATGTVPSGIALVRIMDPNFKTTICVEFGIMQAVGLVSLVYLSLILKPVVSGWSLEWTMLALVACLIPLLIILKVFKLWVKRN